MNVWLLYLYFLGVLYTYVNVALYELLFFLIVEKTRIPITV